MWPQSWPQSWPQIWLILTLQRLNKTTRLTLIVFTSNIDPWAAMVENSVWPELFLTEGRVSRHKSLNLQYRHIHNLSNDEMFLLPGKDRKHSGNNICWSFSCFWRLLTFWKKMKLIQTNYYKKFAGMFFSYYSLVPTWIDKPNHNLLIEFCIDQHNWYA